ncbi:MAG: hypothetical protein RR190_07220, partial [Bacteroidales bacterium]
EYIKDGIGNGAKGYILKNTHPQKIIETIKMVHEGNCVIQDEVLSKLSYSLNREVVKENKLDTSIFTERELEVMKAISINHSHTVLRLLNNNLKYEVIKNVIVPIQFDFVVVDRKE